MSRRGGFRAAMPGLARTVRRFSPHLRRQRGLIGGSTMLLLLEVGFRLLEPWPIKWALDEVISGDAGAGGGGPSVFDSLSTNMVLLVAALAVIVIAGFRALASYLSTVGLALAGNRVLTEVRAELFRHVQRLSLRFHARARTGDLVTRLTGDIGRLQEVTVTAALPLVANTLTLVGMMAVMFWINAPLALAALAALPLLSPTLVRRSTRIRAVARKQRKREGRLASLSTESLAAMKLVQAIGLEGTLERAFAKQNDASLREGVQAKRLAAGLERKVDVLVALGTAMVLYVGARQVRSGALTPGELVVFLMYLKTAFKPMRDLAKYTGRLARAAASGERIIELLDVEPEVRDAPDAVPAPALTGDVRLEGVSLSYEEAGERVLEDLSLHARPGQTIALVGPSGAGKSSAVALLPRLYDPDAGRVLLDGHDVRGLTLASVRSQIAIVLQDSVLFGVSIRENIRYGAPDATDREIEEAARLANADEFVSRLPEGYDTVIGERGATLSGGQRQRIAIARAAVRRAPIVILDEPLTGLDEENEREVARALRRLGRGRTTFVVSHDLRSVADADEILYLDRGRVVERGTHEDLVALDGCYAAVHRLQATQPEAEAPEVPWGALDPVEWSAGGRP